MIFTEKDKKRFWEKVKIGKPDECWEWQAHTARRYGGFRLNKKIEKAHRAAYFLSTGDDPKNMLVCHSCDNPICCNPKHLWKGTHDDNMRDMVKKGRSFQHRSIKNSNGKLTDEEVKEIRKLYVPKKYTLKRLAKQFEVSPNHIWRIIHKTRR